MRGKQGYGTLLKSAVKYPIRFGKYLLLERVNVGGMAEVFKAKTFGVEGFQRNLAIKRILPNMSEDTEFINMFVDEARLAVQLNHANIVQIYELGKHQNQYYIAMEYVAGKDLRRIVEWFRKRKMTMPVPLAALICSKVCEGLDYAHRKLDPQGQPINLVHRDVSPQNILVSFEGDVKVIDFGIAKAADRLSKTQAGVLKGKFGYMSPEQVGGLEIDRRSDLFAVGVLLYEMLTCQRLFVAETDFSTLEKVRQCEIPPMRERNDEVPDELEHVVRTALAKDLNERYQWCSDFAEALQPFLITDKTIFNAKRLASFMKETFKEDIEAEMQRMQEFARITEADVPEPAGPSGTMVTAAPHGTKPAGAEGTQIFETSNDALASAHTHVGSVEEVEQQLAAQGGGTGMGPSGTKRQTAPTDFNVMSTQSLDDDAVAQVQQVVAEAHRTSVSSKTSVGKTSAGMDLSRLPPSGGHTQVFEPLSDRPAAPSKQKWILLGSGLIAVLIVIAALVYRSRNAEPELAWVVLQIEPLGVPIEFFVDEVLVAKGTTPLDNRQLTVGKHNIRIDAGASFSGVSTPVEFKPGTNQVTLQLKPRSGPGPTPATGPTGGVVAATGPAGPPPAAKVTLELDSDPDGATLYLDGQKVGSKVEVEVGKSVVFEAKKDGYKDGKRELQVKKAEKLTLKLEKEKGGGGGNDQPKKAMGFLIVATPGYPDTKVHVDGKDTRRVTPIPPSEPLKLPAGSHSVTLFYKNGIRKQETVTIRAGQTAKLIDKL